MAWRLDSDEVPVTLARSDGPRGEMVLRRRGHQNAVVHELIVNGAFAMDSLETRSERWLAEVAVGTVADGRVLVGGLGLGYTAWEVLQHPVAGVDVVEIEESLIDWARRGLTPTLARVAADPRVRLYACDITAMLSRATEEPSGPWQAILLDVDNGPDFLLHAGNGALYGPELLGAALARLAPGGVLAVWCQGPSPQLLSTLTSLAPTAREHLHQVQRGDRELTYAVYTVSRPPTQDGDQRECGHGE